MERIKKALERAREERQSVRLLSELHLPSALPKPGERIWYTQTRVVAVPPEFFKNKRVIAGLGPGPVTDAYRILRTQVLQRMRQNNWRSLAVTSVGPKEGKTLTAVNLAISLSMEINQTILLVDFDLRQPDVHTYFNYVPDKGLSDYITEDVPLAEILFNPCIERLVILPGNVPVLNSSEMLSSPKTVQLVQELKSKYPSRLVIFDLPPLLSTDDALAVSPYVDAVLLVVEEGVTQKEDLVRAREMLQGVNVIGTVLNMGEAKSED